jgi:hypothetical protein
MQRSFTEILFSLTRVKIIHKTSIRLSLSRKIRGPRGGVQLVQRWTLNVHSHSTYLWFIILNTWYGKCQKHTRVA